MDECSTFIHSVDEAQWGKKRLRDKLRGKLPVATVNVSFKRALSQETTFVATGRWQPV